MTAGPDTATAPESGPSCYVDINLPGIPNKDHLYEPENERLAFALFAETLPTGTDAETAWQRWSRQETRGWMRRLLRAVAHNEPLTLREGNRVRDHYRERAHAIRQRMAEHVARECVLTRPVDSSP